MIVTDCNYHVSFSGVKLSYFLTITVCRLVFSLLYYSDESLHGSDSFVYYIPQMLKSTEIWENMEVKSAPWTLCHVSPTIRAVWQGFPLVLGNTVILKGYTWSAWLGCRYISEEHPHECQDPEFSNPRTYNATNDVPLSKVLSAHCNSWILHCQLPTVSLEWVG